MDNNRSSEGRVSNPYNLTVFLKLEGNSSADLRRALWEAAQRLQAGELWGSAGDGSASATWDVTHPAIPAGAAPSLIEINPPAAVDEGLRVMPADVDCGIATVNVLDRHGKLAALVYGLTAEEATARARRLASPAVDSEE
jgi:hypothetical protein